MSFTRHLLTCCFLPLVLASTSASPVHAQVGLDDWQSLAGGNEVLALAADPLDPDGLWVGSEGGGLLRWNLADASYEQYLFPQQPGLMSNDVYDIAFDGAGDPWLATGEGVTYVRLGAAWQEYTLDHGLPDPWVRSIAVDPDGAVWAGTMAGLAVLDPGASDFLAIPAVDFEPDAEELLEGPGSDEIVDLVAGEDGRIYVAHGRGVGQDQPSLSVYDPAGLGWIHLAEAGVGSSDPGPATDKVMAMDFGPDGRLWMATWSQGVMVWDPGSDEWETHRGSSGPCSNYIWAIDARQAFSPAGSYTEVWAACGSSNSGEGVARYDGESWSTWDLDDGLPTEVVTAIAAAGGSVVLGTNGMGDKRFGGSLGFGLVRMVENAGAAGGYEVVESLVTGGNSPYSNDITSLAFEDDGTLWAGTRGAGLMRRAPLTGLWSRYTFEGTDERLAGNSITALALRRASDGTPELWVGAAATIYDSRVGDYLDGGISVLNLATGNWDYTMRPPQIPGRDIGSIAVGQDGRVWIGFGLANGLPAINVHSGEGLIAYDPSRDSYEPFRFADGDSEGLPGDTVTSLAIGGGQVWAGTAYNNEVGPDLRRMGGGVGVFDGDRWYSWGGGDRGFVGYHGSGIESDTDPFITGDVRSMAMDAAGRAWAGTYELESGDLVGSWPFVDAVINHEADLGNRDWEHWIFPGSGWVSALAEDSLGRMWAGTTRGHNDGNDAMTEHSPSGSRQMDTAVGGAYVLDGDTWIELTPLSSGLASRAITALAWDPTTGHMWVGTENNGLSVNTAGEAILPTPTSGAPTAPPDQTATPRPTLNPPSATPRPTVTPGSDDKPYITLPPPTSDPDDDDDDDQGGASGDDDEPEPPPEVPEAGTWALMLLGLAAIGIWLRFRGQPLESRI